LESIADIGDKLKQPNSPRERPLDDVIKEATEAAVMVLAY
jgi:hypothetical protein